MKVTQVRWLLLGLVVFWLVVMNFQDQPKTIGISSASVNGDYRFSAGTDPVALAFSTLMIGSYLLLINAQQSKCVGQPIPGVFRRFLAFFIDFIIGMTAIMPILGIIPTLVEWKRTGIFQWTFARSTSARGDALQLWVLMPLLITGLVAYHVLPLLRRRPSPGACVMGYCVVPDDGTRMTMERAVQRTLLGFVAVCAAYIAPFIFRDRKQGKFWLDKVFSIHAIALR